MKLVVTQEERDLTATLRTLFGSHCPPALVRRLREPGAGRVPEELWSALTGAELLALPFGEDVGGAGGSLDDLAVLYTEAGRALCPTLVQSTLHLGLAVDLLADDAQRARLLPEVAAGRTRGAVGLWSAYDAADVRPRLRAVPVTDPDGAGALEVSGELDYVADADVADLLALSATASTYGQPDRTVVVLVDPAAAGVSLRPLPAAGGDRWQAVRLDAVRVPLADVLAGPDGSGLTADDLRRVSLRVRALQCLDMVGGAEAVLERTVAHLREREQFGRAIGSFQAAQHLVADMHIALQAARLAARSAVFWHGRGRPAVRETAVAVLHAATAYRRITLDAHQLHGGMGYVLETDLHLWSERARVLGVDGGGPDVVTRWLEEEIGLG